MVRSSTVGFRVAKALDLTVKRAALPERADTTDEACVVKLERVNAVERHGALVSHTIAAS